MVSSKSMCDVQSFERNQDVDEILRTWDEGKTVRLRSGDNT
jgi:hypothetical protein